MIYTCSKLKNICNYLFTFILHKSCKSGFLFRIPDIFGSRLWIPKGWVSIIRSAVRWELTVHKNARQYKMQIRSGPVAGKVVRFVLWYTRMVVLSITCAIMFISIVLHYCSSETLQNLVKIIAVFVVTNIFILFLARIKCQWRNLGKNLYREESLCIMQSYVVLAWTVERTCYK